MRTELISISTPTHPLAWTSKSNQISSRPRRAADPAHRSYATPFDGRSHVSSRYNDAFRTADGSFDLTAFKACLKENDIEVAKVDMEGYGAIGRFRMCVDLMMLRRHALKVGHVIIGGKKIAAPGAMKKRGRKAKSPDACA